jgi:hypothetical protein
MIRWMLCNLLLVKSCLCSFNLLFLLPLASQFFSIYSHPHSYNKKANTRDRKVVSTSDHSGLVYGSDRQPKEERRGMTEFLVHHDSSWRKEDVSVRQR